MIIWSEVVTYGAKRRKLHDRTSPLTILTSKIVKGLIRTYQLCSLRSITDVLIKGGNYGQKNSETQESLEIKGKNIQDKKSQGTCGYLHEQPDRGRDCSAGSHPDEQSP